MLEKLTEKEWQIVESVGRGRTNHEVADELELSHKTVEWTLTRVYRKLGVRSRTELVLLLLRDHPDEEPGVPPGSQNGGI